MLTLGAGKSIFLVAGATDMRKSFDPCIKTLADISALVSALSAIHAADYEVRSLQELHQAAVGKLEA